MPWTSLRQPWWAIRWAASSPRSSRSPSRSGWSAWRWPPPRASAPTRTRSGTRWAPWVRRMQPLLAVQTGWIATHAEAVTRRRRLRDATLNVAALYPGRLPAALAAEMLRGAGKPGFVEALEANLNYDFRHRLPEIVCPTLIVWGERDRLIIGARRRRLYGDDSRRSQGDLCGYGAHRDARAPGEVQRSAGGVSQRGTGRAQRVRAPAASWNAAWRCGARRGGAPASASDGAFGGRPHELGVLLDGDLDVLVGARGRSVELEALGDLPVAERHVDAARVDVDGDLDRRRAARRWVRRGRPRGRRGRP